MIHSTQHQVENHNMALYVNYKSNLAKLMATENLSVEHRKINTAKFDLKNRVLYLPLWENMSDELYDLFTGHEVGHALFTPIEGWHDSVTEEKNPNFKSFLNVVEDARIEKKIQRKYPGIRRSFLEAYRELDDMDFFGIHDLDVDEMIFIDRLNLHCKLRSNIKVKFKNDIERSFVERVENIETWEDTYKLAKEIFEYCKDEINSNVPLDMDFDYSYGTEDDDFEYTESDFGDESKSDSVDSDSVKNNTKSKSANEDQDDDAGDSGSDEKNDEESSKDKTSSEKTFVNRYKDQNESSGDYDQEKLKSVTDENFRKNESRFVYSGEQQYYYLDIPKPIWENVHTPPEKVHSLMRDFFVRVYKQDDMNKFFDEFKRRNSKFIDLLVKEFEMKKEENNKQVRQTS